VRGQQVQLYRSAARTPDLWDAGNWLLCRGDKDQCTKKRIHKVIRRSQSALATIGHSTRRSVPKGVMMPRTHTGGGGARTPFHTQAHGNPSDAWREQSGNGQNGQNSA